MAVTTKKALRIDLFVEKVPEHGPGIKDFDVKGYLLEGFSDESEFQRFNTIQASAVETPKDGDYAVYLTNKDIYVTKYSPDSKYMLLGVVLQAGKWIRSAGFNYEDSASEDKLDELFNDMELSNLTANDKIAREATAKYCTKLINDKIAREATAKYCTKLINDLPYSFKEIGTIAICYFDGYLDSLKAK